MVPDVARIKLMERIAMAQRLGGMFSAEAVGMADALNGVDHRGALYAQKPQRESYERGYRDAREIIAMEATLAARVAKAV